MLFIDADVALATSVVGAAVVEAAAVVIVVGTVVVVVVVVVVGGAFGSGPLVPHGAYRLYG